MSRWPHAMSAVAFLLAGTSTPSMAAPPAPIHFQGAASDMAGHRLTAPVNLVFRYYDAASAGALLATETQNAVPVSDGVFNAALGTGTLAYAGGVSSFSDLFQNHDNVWVGVSVNADAEMTPRVQFVSVPFALRAASADALGGQAANTYVSTGSQAQTKTGPLSVVSSTDGITGVMGQSQGQGGKGVYGVNDSQGGRGVYGENTDPGASGYGSAGVYGHLGSASYHASSFPRGAAVRGETQTGDAVQGDSSAGYGVYGHSASSSGVVGLSASYYGVDGESANGGGVFGWATGASGSGNGVRGEAAGSGDGVYGNSATGSGVFGYSASGAGSGDGVHGESGAGNGVYGYSQSSGTGVQGVSISGAGVIGKSGFTGNGTQAGVHGYSGSGEGVWGTATGTGVFGESTAAAGSGTIGVGVTGSSHTYAGVYGQNDGSGGVGVQGNGGPGGIGVRGVLSSSTGTSVLGINYSLGVGVEGVSYDSSHSGGAAGIGVKATGSGQNTALQINNGALQVAGATRPVFIWTVTAASVPAGADYTVIDNTLTNGDPNVMLVVTHNFVAAHIGAVGVWFNGANWTIFREDGQAMPANEKFTVMVVKQ